MSQSNEAISAARVKDVHSIVYKMCSDWSKGIDSQIPPSQFFSIYHPTIEWFDHAFQVHRIGIGSVNDLRFSWLGCNRPLQVDVQAIHVTSDGGAIFEHTSSGKFSHDLVRPSGELVQTASGKAFCFRGVIRLRIDEDGKITRVDEWYTRNWDASEDEGKYRVLENLEWPTGARPAL